MKRDLFKGKKFNTRMCQPHPDGGMRLRVRQCPARGKHGPRLVIRCGDCPQRLEVYFGHDDDFLEIGGVMATKREWRDVLGPLLKSRRR